MDKGRANIITTYHSDYTFKDLQKADTINMQ